PGAQIAVAHQDIGELALDRSRQDVDDHNRTLRARQSNRRVSDADGHDVTDTLAAGGHCHRLGDGFGEPADAAFGPRDLDGRWLARDPPDHEPGRRFAIERGNDRYNARGGLLQL